MNRSQKITAVKITFIALFVFSIIITVFFQFPIDKTAIILYPLITVLVLVWRSVRDDYDIFILSKLVFDIDDDLSEVEFLGKYVFRSGLTTLIFNKFQMKSKAMLKIHFDIANKGNSEVALHDYKVKVLHPQEELLVSNPIFESVHIYNPIENRYTMEVNYLRRKHLDKGGLTTIIFPFEPPSQYLIIKIEAYTYQCEYANEYLFYFIEDCFFYAKCTSTSLLRLQKERSYFKLESKIEEFLKRHIE
jgi:hypothetical protein